MINININIYIWSRVSCSPPTTSTGGEGYIDICISYTHTYTYCLHLHMHILHTYTLLTYIYMYNLHIHIGTITISGGEGTTRRWATELYTHTWTVLEPHSFRSLWIFRCRPKNHLWAKSDGLQNQQVIDFWSLTTFQSRPQKMQLLDVQV